MNSDSKLNEIQNSVYQCIRHYFKMHVSDVPIKYVDDIEFYYYLKANSYLPPELFENIEAVKDTYQKAVKFQPGIYKYRERTVLIRIKDKYDACLLLVELLHSKSITQFYKTTELWIKEGLPHYLSKIICKNCKFLYSDTTHERFYPIWEYIHRKSDFDTLSAILFPFNNNIRITIGILKGILKYNKDDVLEIPFNKVSNYLSKQD